MACRRVSAPSSARLNARAWCWWATAGFSYTAQELATAVEELDSPLVVLLWNNDALGQIRDDMLNLDIQPIGVLPPNPDFAAPARAFGCTVSEPQNLDELQTDLRNGFKRNGVTLIELKHACV